MADKVERMLSAETDFSAEIVADVVAVVQRLEQDAKASALAAAKHNRRKSADVIRKRRKKKLSAENKKAPSFLLAIDSDSKKERKNGESKNPKLIDAAGNSTDDWPEDYADQFWAAWPEHQRKYGLSQVVTKLTRIRKSGVVTWAVLFGQLAAYFDSRPEVKFIPAPMVWLNQGRWSANYAVGRRDSFDDALKRAMGLG